MSTLSVGTIQSSTTSPPTINNSAGTAIGTFCLAWVNFNGTGTVAIRASFNVTSITDNGTGNYTVTFTNGMTDANYCPVVSGNNSTTGLQEWAMSVGDLATDSLRVNFGDNNGDTAFDGAIVAAAIFR